MKILSENRCSCGEGPIWNEFDNKLYHVNGGGSNEISVIDLKSGEVNIKKFDFAVFAIAFSKENRMMISCKDGAFYLNSDGTRQPLYDTERYVIKNGNDAKVGPDGRFYIGTQSSKRLGEGNKTDGSLYSIDKNGEVKVLLDGMILSNGFDWSMDEKRFYHTDSGTKFIKEYHFKKETGSLSFTGRQILVKGVDGFTIDQRDMLYAACWGCGHIAVVDTKDMQIKDYIEVPAKIPASCAFAGPDMEKLVVVTSTLRAQLESDRYAGYTFICDPKTRGRKPYLFG